MANRTPQEVNAILQSLAPPPQISTQNAGQTLIIYDPSTQAKAVIKRAESIRSRTSSGTYR
ncbi:hypothetical protein [Pantanalinema sp. GBBB05]|uniref:hypothetical protein n=1 Tax=Pantanalinema sp. GBBB05 TaxID=2604139 RepID=UPI001E19C97A|nr:hypothetical protein [Pantanalinema sp. GBBB05]